MRPDTLELHDVQSLVLQESGHLFARFTFLAIDDVEGARKWLRDVGPRIASATHQGGPVLNLAFTYRGLAKLALPPSLLAQFPEDFRLGLAERWRTLGDPFRDEVQGQAPLDWPGVPAPDATHILVMMHAESDQALNRLGAEVLGGAGLRVTYEQSGKLRADRKEHFGFRDGISQPNIDDPALRASGSPKDNVVKAGEFVLGYPDEEGVVTDMGWVGANGTFLVYLKLEQDVDAFHAFLADAHPDSEVDAQRKRDRLAAGLVGRWPSGAPLVLAPDADDEALGSDPLRNNGFDYREDLRGFQCPLGAHIRRANPRLDPSRTPNRHRLIRRGIPYEDNDRGRGLIGVFLNASIDRQFEFVHKNWLNSSKANGLGNSTDPLLADHSGTGYFEVQKKDGRVRHPMSFRRFVSMRGGDYFFVPGLRALSHLARLSAETVPAGEAAAIEEIIASAKRKLDKEYAASKGTMPRDVHAKGHGFVDAQFIVDPDLPQGLRFGVLTEPGARFKALIRFSNGSGDPRASDDDRDLRGMAIKLLGVGGPKLLLTEGEHRLNREGEKRGPQADTQDFVLSSQSVFFAKDARSMVDFVLGLEKGSVARFFVPWHLDDLRKIWRAISTPVTSPLATRYWSQTPYRLGPHVVKYTARPMTFGARTRPSPAHGSPNRLRETLAAQLATQEYAFEFAVQLRTDPDRMPIEDPRVEWPEESSPFLKVATIVIPPQEFTQKPDPFGENASFNPWHSLAEHMPLGGINRARKVVYQAIAAHRRSANVGVDPSRTGNGGQ